MPHPTLSISPPPKRVLLAVEDAVSGDLLEHRMSRRGLHPTRVPHGQEATDRLRDTRFDLVVIETRLPGLTGLELLRRVPTDTVAGRPLIVLLGQHGNDEEIVRAFELGAAEYISRPFAPEVALARILRFLGGGSELVSRPAAASLLVGPVSVASSDLLTLMVGLTAVLLLVALLFALAAAGLHVWARRDERRERRLTSTWRATLLDVLAGDAAPKDLHEQVPSGEARRFLAFLVPYAATFEGRARTVITHLASPFLPALEDDLARDRPGTRARGVQLLGLLDDASCRGLLRRRLDDPSRLVAYTAFRWLCRRGTPADAPVLLDRLDRFSSADVTQLASSLVHLGPDAAPPLRSALADDAESTVVRTVCAETLRWMGDGESAPLAAQLLADEPAPELTASLLRLLRRVGCPEHALLVRTYCNSAVPFVRIHAARALGQIGHADRDRTRLRRLVTDAPSRWVAYNAAKSLTELGQTSPLYHLTQTDHDRAALAHDVLHEPAL
jgi:CheY-like chemotaxis protein/HEAT repeat protein